MTAASLDAILSATRGRIADLRARAAELERRAVDRARPRDRSFASPRPHGAGPRVGRIGGGPFGGGARPGARRRTHGRRGEQPRLGELRGGPPGRGGTAGPRPGERARGSRKRDRGTRGRRADGGGGRGSGAGGHVGGPHRGPGGSRAGADGRSAETEESVSTLRPVERAVDGRFGPYGGRYVPETLIAALEELAAVYKEAQGDPRFWEELDGLLKDYVGRPTPITETPRLATQVGEGVVMLLKREDLNHTGAHKINNTLGQVLLARCMGKRRIIAETGAGQHGVATATVCARFGLACVVYMGEADMRRQRLNVYRMELMGAQVVPVTSGTKTLKDATNEALRDWVTNVTTTHYIIGSVVGPDPFPRLVRDFQAVIGREARAQVLERYVRLPRSVVACVGGGSNAIGIFSGFLDDTGVELVGVEAAGERTAAEHPSASPAPGAAGAVQHAPH